MYKVFHLKRQGGLSNAYAVNRFETLKVRFHKSFETLEEAEKYVEQIHRYSPAFIVLAHELNDETQKQAFLREFAVTNDLYLLQRDYFIADSDKTLVKRLKEKYIADGIEVLPDGK